MKKTSSRLVFLISLYMVVIEFLYKEFPYENFKGPGQTAIMDLAQKHLEMALPNVVTGNYSGEHWLASFAVLALSKANHKQSKAAGK